jgi:hypothetical protein
VGKREQVVAFNNEGEWGGKMHIEIPRHLIQARNVDGIEQDTYHPACP